MHFERNVQDRNTYHQFNNNNNNKIWLSKFKTKWAKSVLSV